MAISYPHYVLEGTPLNDSADRWYESSEHSFQPSFAGLNASSFEAYGTSGATPIRLAPGRVASETITMTFNAIDKNGARAQSWAERQQFIYRNLEDFYREVGLSSGLINPRLQLVKHVDANTTRYAFGRIEAGSSPSYTPGDETAEMKFIFTIYDGYWRSAETTTAKQAGTGTVTFGSGNANAPIQDALVRVYGPITNPTLSGDLNGFTYKGTIADGQCIEFATKVWKVGTTAATNAIGTAPLSTTANIQQNGPMSGTMLTLVPDKLGKYSFTLSGTATGVNTGVQVQYREAFN